MNAKIGGDKVISERMELIKVGWRGTAAKQWSVPMGFYFQQADMGVKDLGGYCVVVQSDPDLVFQIAYTRNRQLHMWNKHWIEMRYLYLAKCIGL